MRCKGKIASLVLISLLFLVSLSIPISSIPPANGQPSELTITSNELYPIPYQKFTIASQLSAEGSPIVGETVDLYRSLDNSSWHRADSDTTDSSGYAYFNMVEPDNSITYPASGDIYYKSIYEGKYEEYLQIIDEFGDVIGQEWVENTSAWLYEPVESGYPRLFIDIFDMPYVTYYDYSDSVTTLNELTDPAKVTLLTGEPIGFYEDSNMIQLNFTSLMVEFYKDSQGYNKIMLPDGTVLVYDDRIVLEEWRPQGQGRWNQRGIPQIVTYEQINDYYYTVDRWYRDWGSPETTMNVTYHVKSNSPMKITVTINNGQTDNYRIAWYPSGITTGTEDEFDNRVWFGNPENEYAIQFDWNDVYQSFGDITTTSYESVAQGRKANIYFELGEIQEGETVILDPTVVASQNQNNGLGSPQHTKLFYDSDDGLWWYFLLNMTSPQTLITYYTATTPTGGGADWSSVKSFPVTMTIGGWSADYNGTHFAYVSSNQTHLFFRQGVPESDSTITWDAAEQLVATGDYVNNDIVLSSTGYAYISTREDGADDLLLFKNDVTNGTWVDDAGNPFDPTATDAANLDTSIHRYEDGDVYIIYYVSGGNYYGQGFDAGTETFDGEETIGADPDNLSNHHAVVKDDVLYLAWDNATIHLSSRPHDAGAWTYEAEINGTTDSWRNSGMAISANGTIVIMWGDTTDNKFYMSTNATGSFDYRVWLASATAIAKPNFFVKDDLAGQFTAGDWGVYVAYQTGAGAPYDYSVAEIVAKAPSNTSPTMASLTAPATIYGYDTSEISMVVNDDDGFSDLKNATISLDTLGIDLNWFQSDNSTTITDASNYASLESSSTTTVNSTAVTVAFNVKLYWNFTEGTISTDGSTKVWDDSDASGSGTASSWFIFEDDLEIYSNGGTNNQAGVWYYDSTEGWTWRNELDVNDYITIPRNHLESTEDGEFTIETYIYIETAGDTGWQELAQKGYSWQTDGWELYCRNYSDGDADVGFYWNWAGGDEGVIWKTLDDTIMQNWLHIVVTYSDSAPRVELWVNDVSRQADTSVTELVDDTSNPMVIGNDGDNNVTFAFFRIYDDVLSNAEISTNYASATNNDDTFTQGNLIQYLSFDEGRGLSIHDKWGTRASDYNVNPSDSVTVTGDLVYEGTATAPTDSTGITGKVELSGVSSGTTATIQSNGTFAVTFNAESNVATSGYNVFASTDQNTVTNQTVTVITDVFTIQDHGVTDARSDVDVNNDVYFDFAYAYDDVRFTDSMGSLTIEGEGATYDGSDSRWEIVETNSSVGIEWWQSSDISITDNYYGITGVGTALYFDGSNDYVTVGSDSSIDNFTGDFTVEIVWNIPDISVGTEWGLEKGDWGDDEWGIYHNNVGSGYMENSDGGTSTAVGVASVFQNGEKHYVVIYDDDDNLVYFYRDGSLIDSIAQTRDQIATTGKTLQILRKDLGSYYEGTISLVRLYSDSLSTSEITTNYNSYAYGNESYTLGNLELYLDFNEKSDVTVQDKTANNNDGTLTNFATIEPYTTTSQVIADDIIWDGIKVVSLSAPTYLGSGQYQYTATLQYAYDSATIGAGTAKVQMANGTSTSAFTADGSGLITFVLDSAINATTSGTFTIYGNTDPTYTLTVKNTNATETLREITINAKTSDGSTDVDDAVTLALEKSGTSVNNPTDGTAYRYPDDTFDIEGTWNTINVYNTTLVVNTDSTEDIATEVVSLTGNIMQLAIDDLTLSANAWDAANARATTRGTSTTTKTLFIDMISSSYNEPLWHQVNDTRYTTGTYNAANNDWYVSLSMTGTHDITVAWEESSSRGGSSPSTPPTTTTTTTTNGNGTTPTTPTNYEIVSGALTPPIAQYGPTIIILTIVSAFIVAIATDRKRKIPKRQKAFTKEIEYNMRQFTKDVKKMFNWRKEP